MSQKSHCTRPTMYKYFYFKTEIKTKVDSYMPCEAMAHSPKSGSGEALLYGSATTSQFPRLDIAVYIAMCQVGISSRIIMWVHGLVQLSLGAYTKTCLLSLMYLKNY